MNVSLRDRLGPLEGRLRRLLARPDSGRTVLDASSDPEGGVFPGKLDTQSDKEKYRLSSHMFAYGFIAMCVANIFMADATRILSKKQRVVAPPAIITIDPDTKAIIEVRTLDPQTDGLDLLTHQYIDETLVDRYEIVPIDAVMAAQWDRGARIKKDGMVIVKGGGKLYNRYSEDVFDEFARVANARYDELKVLDGGRGRSHKLDRTEMAKNPPESLGNGYWRRSFTIVEYNWQEKEVRRIPMVATMHVDYQDRIVQSIDAQKNPLGFIVDIYSATGRN